MDFLLLLLFLCYQRNIIQRERGPLNLKGMAQKLGIQVPIGYQRDWMGKKQRPFVDSPNILFAQKNTKKTRGNIGFTETYPPYNQHIP